MKKEKKVITVNTFKKPTSIAAVTSFAISIVASIMFFLRFRMTLLFGSSEEFLYYIFALFIILCAVAFITGIIGAISCRATGVRSGMIFAVLGIAFSLMPVYVVIIGLMQ